MKELKMMKRAPVLFIGCGGTGFKVIKDVYKKVVEEFEEDLKNDNLLVDFLVIDTHSGEFYEDVNFPDENFFSLGPIQLDRFLNNEYEKDELIKEWLDKNQYGCLMATGAMQIRAFGRYALFVKIKDVYNLISQKVNKLISKMFTDKVKSDITAPLNIHIVGNIAGGTGSGIMLDLAYLIKFITEKPITVFAHLLTPDYITDIQLKDSLQANAYAFLKELDNFNQNPELYVKFSPIIKYYYRQMSQSQSIEELLNNLRTPPFDFIFLLSPFTKDFHYHDELTFIDVVSERLFLSTFNEVIDREMARLVNISDVLNNIFKDKNIKRGKLCKYSSYGITTFNFREEYLETLIKKAIIDRLLKELENLENKIIEVEISYENDLKSYITDFKNNFSKLGIDVEKEKIEEKLKNNDNIIDDNIIEKFLKNKDIKKLVAKDLDQWEDEDSGQKEIIENYQLYQDKVFDEFEERVDNIKQFINKIKIELTEGPTSQNKLTTFQYVFVNLVPVDFLESFIQKWIGFSTKINDIMLNLLKTKKIKNIFETEIKNIIQSFKSSSSKGGFNFRQFIELLSREYPEKVDDIIEIILAFASPCWQYTDYYDSYVHTIAIIGCKKDHFLFNKLKHRNFYKAKLEATDTEEDPLDIPLLISQHGLPLLGYELLKKYKVSYNLMKTKFISSKLKKQLHLDKRWEQEDSDILIDPFFDYPESYINFYYEQLFIFAWYSGLIKKDALNKFSFEYTSSMEDIEIELSKYSSTLKSVVDYFKININEKLELIIKKSIEDKINNLIPGGTTISKNIVSIIREDFDKWAEDKLKKEDEKKEDKTIKQDNIIKRRLRKLFYLYIENKFKTLLDLEIDNYLEFYKSLKDEI